VLLSVVYGKSRLKSVFMKVGYEKNMVLFFYRCFVS
jgi:hypothetical protein